MGKRAHPCKVSTWRTEDAIFHSHGDTYVRPTPSRLALSRQGPLGANGSRHQAVSLSYSKLDLASSGCIAMHTILRWRVGIIKDCLLLTSIPKFWLDGLHLHQLIVIVKIANKGSMYCVTISYYTKQGIPPGDDAPVVNTLKYSQLPHCNSVYEVVSCRIHKITLVSYYSTIQSSSKHKPITIKPPTQ